MHLSEVVSSGFAAREVSRETTQPEDPVTTREWDRLRCTKGKCRAGTLRVIVRDGGLLRQQADLLGRLDLLKGNEGRVGVNEPSLRTIREVG